MTIKALQAKRESVAEQLAHLDAVIAMLDGDARTSARARVALRDRTALQIDAARSSNGHGGSRPISPAGSMSSRMLDFLRGHPDTSFHLSELVERFRAHRHGIESALARARKRGFVRKVGSATWQYGADVRTSKAAKRKATKGKATKGKATKGNARKTKTNGGRSTFGQRWYALLKNADGPQSLSDSSRKLGANFPATVLSAGKRWIAAGAIEKVGKGRYQVGSGTPPA